MTKRCPWLLCVLLGAGLALAQEGDPEMEAWMKLNQPGEMHAVLEAFVGSFDAVSETPATAAGPGQSSEGTCVNSWQLGGRFVESRYSVDFMGMPFDGIGFMGFDNLNGKFTHLWLDNMSTHMLTSEGTISEDKKTITFVGEMGAGGETQTFKFVFEIESNDKHIFKMYNEIGGRDMLAMTVTYTRQGSATER